MRKDPHVRICGGLGSATTLVYPTVSGSHRCHLRGRKCQSTARWIRPDIDAVRPHGGARATVSDVDLDHAFDVRLSGGSRLGGTRQIKERGRAR